MSINSGIVASHAKFAPVFDLCFFWQMESVILVLQTIHCFWTTSFSHVFLVHAESMHCDTCLRYQHLYIYIYMYIYVYIYIFDISLSLYIYMYTFMGTAVRSSDLWTRIIKHHAIMYVHCHHLNQVVGKHNTSEACEITGESVHGRNMGSPQYLCLHGFRIPWKVVDKRCTGMYSEGSISHAKGNKSIYLEHF